MNISGIVEKHDKNDVTHVDGKVLLHNDSTVIDDLVLVK